MDVKNLLEKLLFDEELEEVADEPLQDVDTMETIRTAEPVKPIETVEEKVEDVPQPTFVEQPTQKPRKTLIDVNEVTYRPNYKTAASIEKAQYVRQEPLSPIFGLVSDKDKEEKKLTTPQFPSNIEGSRKVESVLSPIFGKEVPNEEEQKVEEVVEIIETKVEETKEDTVTFKTIDEVTEKPYVPRHAEIKPEDNDVFYTNGLELDKIISLLNDPEEEAPSVQEEDTSFLDAILNKKESDPDTISIFDDAE